MPTFWQTERCRIHALSVEDVDSLALLSRWEDAESQYLGGELLPPTSPGRIRRRIQAIAERESDGDALRLVIERMDGEIIGEMMAFGCIHRRGTFSLGLVIQPAHRRHGYAKETLPVLLRYFFCELRYHKANAQVYAFNAASISLFQSLGFVQEGTQRDMIYVDGAYHDVFLFGMTEGEFALWHPAESVIDRLGRANR